MVAGKTAVWMMAGLMGAAAVGAWAADAPAKAGPGGGKFWESKLGQFIAGRLVRLGELKNDLNITDDQKARLQAIRREHRPEVAPLVKAIVQKKQALRDAVMADAPDEKAIRAAADEVGKAIGDAAVALVKPVGEVKKVLTSDQMETLREFRQERDDNLMSWLDRDPAE